MTELKNVKCKSDEWIQTLSEKCSSDHKFEQLLVSSLKKAKKKAKANLDQDLFDALQWPTSMDEYRTYLIEFARWIPQQSDNDAWKKPGTDQYQEVYDRLCHFYFLVDQKVGPDQVVVEERPWFRDWLVNYVSDWGSFLNTTDSFNEDVLNSFRERAPKYQVENSMVNGQSNNPSGWLTFNQFFARELNPGLRPISDPDDNTVVTSPADCTYRAKYDIDENSKIPEITLKKTHKYASVKTLLEGSSYKDAFANGTFVHYFLGPYSYHRFHTPVAGAVKECYSVSGSVYLEVNLSKGQFDAPDSSEGGYEFRQQRGVIVQDTADSSYGDVGKIAVIPVGMAQVSSVNMTATEGSTLRKGDEFGYFLFGASDIIVLFQDGANPDIDTGDQYRHYGTPIARCAL